MNKENQKKYKEYQKLAAKRKNAYDKVNEVLDKITKVREVYATEHAKFEKKWQPKLKAADKAIDDANKKHDELTTKCKEMRKAFIAQDNPDRQELLDLLLS